MLRLRMLLEMLASCNLRCMVQQQVATKTKSLSVTSNIVDLLSSVP
jgi:hypothetical protein